MMTNWATRSASTVYHKANILVCGFVHSYTAEQVKDLMNQGASLAGRAKTVFEVEGAFRTLSRAEEQLQSAVGEINAKLKEGEHLASHASAACEISEAIGVLNTWDLQSNSRTSSEQAAKAFDQLFGGVASFMHYLPFPLSLYEDTFKDIAKYGFFSNIRNMQDPGGSGSTSGRMMQQVDKLPELGRH
jgi:uncharacterized protein YgbK (DUF1537 family)